jgi:RNA polymerase sigma-70 factor (ECF subfamily)
MSCDCIKRVLGLRAKDTPLQKGGAHATSRLAHPGLALVHDGEVGKSAANAKEDNRDQTSSVLAFSANDAEPSNEMQRPRRRNDDGMTKSPPSQGSQASSAGLPALRPPVAINAAADEQSLASQQVRESDNIVEQPLADLPSLYEPAESELQQEAQLVARLRKGEARAFEDLLRELGPRLYAVAKRFLPNDEDAREAMQDAMLSAYRSIDKFDERSRLSTWLHRIVVNASLMKLRTRRRKPSVSLEGLGASRSGDEGSSFAASIPDDASTARTGREQRLSQPTLEENELRNVLREQMELLPDEYRTVLLLRDVEELDTLQTARVLNISESAVKTRLHRARLALREAMLKATGAADTSAEQDTRAKSDASTRRTGGAQ